MKAGKQLKDIKVGDRYKRTNAGRYSNKIHEVTEVHDDCFISCDVRELVSPPEYRTKVITTDKVLAGLTEHGEIIWS